MKETNQKQSH